MAKPQALNDVIAALVDELLAHPGTERTIIAIAGPPGVGKSTFADTLCCALDPDERGIAAVLPMDGYHLDDAILNARGWRPRKGAPHTFDVGGLASTLERLHRQEEDQVAVPVFDRDLELSRGSARIISRGTRFILCEGNYLLLKAKPWSSLKRYFDSTIMLTAPFETIEARLTERWKGYNYDDAALTAKLEGNDLPNVRAVLEESIEADLSISTDDHSD